VDHPAAGALGGLPGTAGELHLGSGQRLRAKGRQVVPAGDTLRVGTPGGGGLGQPAQRPAEQLAADIRQGLVTHWPELPEQPHQSQQPKQPKQQKQPITPTHAA